MRPKPRTDLQKRPQMRMLLSGILSSCRPTTLILSTSCLQSPEIPVPYEQRCPRHTVGGLNSNSTQTWLLSSSRLYAEGTQINLAMVECVTIVTCACVPCHAVIVVAIVVERPRVRVHARATKVLDPFLVRNLDGLVTMWAHSPRIIWTVGITTVHELLRHLL